MRASQIHVGHNTHPRLAAPHHHTCRRLAQPCRAAADDSQQVQLFQQVLSSVEQQPSYAQLQQLLEEDPANRAFSASFLFWLSAQEKKAVGPRKQQLAQLAAQLVLLKEQAEAEASRRMLPPLASSLAYSNYMQWRSSHSNGGGDDVDLPEVTPGVSLTDLYRAAEREEAKLKQWQNPRQPASTLDNFAAASGYGSFAADAMARVRARLAGFEDDDTLQQQQQQSGAAPPDAQGQQPQQAQPVAAGVSPAAIRVLDELLLGCCCREERATLLPEAFVPPGLEVLATGSPSGSSSSTAKARVLTNPQRLLAAVAARLQEQSGGQQPSQQPSQQQQQQPGLLPSGEGVVQVLHELQEDIREFDQHVYSKMSQRDMQGL